MIPSYPLITLNRTLVPNVLNREILSNGSRPISNERMCNRESVLREKGVKEVVESFVEDWRGSNVPGEGLVVSCCRSMKGFDGSRWIDS